MIRLENHLGVIEISQPYFASLIGNAASSCFGVAGMANSNVRQGLRSVFKKNSHFADQGINVRKDGEGLIVDLHIMYPTGSTYPPYARASSTRSDTPLKRLRGLKSTPSMSMLTE